MARVLELIFKTENCKLLVKNGKQNLYSFNRNKFKWQWELYVVFI